MCAREKRPFAYALLRLVPQIERGERLNVGVVLFSRQDGFLDLRTRVDEVRLHALDPACDPAPVTERLGAIRAVVRGEADAGALARLPPSERFGWLVAPSSTIIQPSEVHTGLTADPAATLARLFSTLVV